MEGGSSRATTVLARLQSLLPHHASIPSNSAPVAQSPLPAAQPVKIRIVTWNMHDSIPKGKLEELLGVVPKYQRRDGSLSAEDSLRIPDLSESPQDDHPYHLVIVAAQECPSVSGAPMGLGAGVHLSKDKDKDKEEELQSKSKKYYHHKSIHRKERHEDESLNDLSDANSFNDSPEASTRSKRHHLKHSKAPAPYGWTSLVGDWYCKGRGCNFAQPSNLDDFMNTNGTVSKSSPGSSGSVGPYELLCKERLMGIYLTVYVNRDVRHLVRGSSKSSVTAGLLRGRVGNKGGVGISLNFHGTTFLFLCVHLAAHEERVKHRVANMCKIKAELVVEDFLDAKDNRAMAEDFTDRFDHTFLFGDLNFRLDISRLHADWLLSQKDYAQALTFDQLSAALKTESAFAGFEEAPIDFPPTFKYDVLRAVKSQKHRHGRHPRHKKSLTDLDEKREVLTNSAVEDAPETPGFAVPDSASIISRSSVGASMHNQKENTKDLEDIPIRTRTDSASSAAATLSSCKRVKAIEKARNRWLALLSRSSSTLALQTDAAASTVTLPSPSPITPLINIPMSPSTPSLGIAGDSPLPSPAIDRLMPPPFKRSDSARSHAEEMDLLSLNAEEKAAVYDSSAKQRVPSWCDRILWKTTIKHDTEQFPHQAISSPKAKRNSRGFGQILHKSHLSTNSEIQSSRAIPPETVDTNAHSNTPSNKDVSRGPTLPRITTDPGNLQKRRSHSFSVVASDPPSDGNSEPRSASSSYSPATQRRFSSGPTARNWFFQLIGRGTSVEPKEAPSTTTKSSDVVRRKGDVVALSYRTLDDAQMRRLEGRSDHRPVIGAFAVYI